jgi:hypothetical protein
MQICRHNPHPYTRIYVNREGSLVGRSVGEKDIECTMLIYRLNCRFVRSFEDLMNKFGKE